MDYTAIKTDRLVKYIPPGKCAKTEFSHCVIRLTFHGKRQRNDDNRMTEQEAREQSSLIEESPRKMR
jgi:hypothetical protein